MSNSEQTYIAHIEAVIDKKDHNVYINTSAGGRDLIERFNFHKFKGTGRVTKMRLVEIHGPFTDTVKKTTFMRFDADYWPNRILNIIMYLAAREEYLKMN